MLAIRHACISGGRAAPFVQALRGLSNDHHTKRGTSLLIGSVMALHPCPAIHSTVLTCSSFASLQHRNEGKPTPLHPPSIDSSELLLEKATNPSLLLSHPDFQNVSPTEASFHLGLFIGRSSAWTARGLPWRVYMPGMGLRTRREVGMLEALHRLEQGLPVLLQPLRCVTMAPDIQHLEKFMAAAVSRGMLGGAGKTAESLTKSGTLKSIKVEGMELRNGRSVELHSLAELKLFSAIYNDLLPRQEMVQNAYPLATPAPGSSANEIPSRGSLNSDRELKSEEHKEEAQEQHERLQQEQKQQQQHQQQQLEKERTIQQLLVTASHLSMLMDREVKQERGEILLLFYTDETSYLKRFAYYLFQSSALILPASWALLWPLLASDSSMAHIGLDSLPLLPESLKMFVPDSASQAATSLDQAFGGATHTASETAKSLLPSASGTPSTTAYSLSPASDTPLPNRPLASTLGSLWYALFGVERTVNSLEVSTLAGAATSVSWSAVHAAVTNLGKSLSME